MITGNLVEDFSLAAITSGMHSLTFYDLILLNLIKMYTTVQKFGVNMIFFLYIYKIEILFFRKDTLN